MSLLIKSVLFIYSICNPLIITQMLFTNVAVVCENLNFIMFVKSANIYLENVLFD